MKIEQGFYIKDDLVRRGWTVPMISEFYGVPDICVSQGYKQKKFKFYNRSRIWEIENSNAFKKVFRERALQAQERKWRESRRNFRDIISLCEKSDVTIYRDEIPLVVERASGFYNELLYLHAGVVKQINHEDWTDSLSFERLMNVCKSYVKLNRSNVPNLYNVLDSTRYFKENEDDDPFDRQKYIDIIESNFIKEFKRTYPYFEECCLVMMADRFPEASYASKMLLSSNKN